ncbi:MAG: peptide chain release factor N(5)-glutamine methyltransferase [Bacilli bacterium]|nr:peptide chain release factor N(5)-glutamine methyltransferase [Bacilli bacterium]
MLNKILDLGISKREAEELLRVSKNIDEDYNKLLNDYPIQYLIGYVDFYGYKINVNKNVLIPRYETEYLVEKTINYVKQIFDRKVDILDIGTGSGAISIALKKNLKSNITAVDISSEALDVAKENANINGTIIDFIESDVFSNVKGEFDVIISNPPYISEDEKIMDSVKKYEPHLALYAKDNGLYFYEKIIDESKKYLNKKFIIAFEIGWWQAESICNIAKKYYHDSKIIVEKDLSQKDRYIFIINE